MQTDSESQESGRVCVGAEPRTEAHAAGGEERHGGARGWRLPVPGAGKPDGKRGNTVWHVLRQLLWV